MKLHGAKARMVDRVRRPHSQGVGVPAALFRIAAIEDRHVAADAVRAFEKSAGRRIGFDRRDDLDEGEPERKQRVFQPVLAHVRVLVGELHPQDRFHVADHARQIVRHQANLPQAEIVGQISVLSGRRPSRQRPLKTGGRFSTKAAAASR